MENSQNARHEDFSVEDDPEVQESVGNAAAGEFDRLLKKLKADATPKETS